MDENEIHEIAERNPQVDLDLLRRARAEMKQIFVEPATYDIESPFGRRRLAPRRPAARAQTS